jgi:hypothetical protein
VISVKSASETDSLFVDEEVVAVPAPPANDMGAFLGTLATLLRETIARFEQTADRVSDMMMKHNGRAGPELIVALQDFDRLQQEFSALGEVLARMQIATAGPWPGKLDADELKHELLKTVTIAKLKERLALHFEKEDVIEPATPSSDGIVAEF